MTTAKQLEALRLEFDTVVVNAPKGLSPGFNPVGLRPALSTWLPAEFDG